LGAIARGTDTGHPVLWRNPGNVAAMDFTGGPGGRERAPRPPFTFLKEDRSGTNPKVRVRDAAGREWTVKFGPEVSSETFASRLAWAVGYFVEPDYYVASGTIAGTHDLGRAKKYIDSNGSFEDARFKLRVPSVKKFEDEESWRFDQNPFVGSHELTGLRIMLMLTSNWDVKDQRDYKSDGSNTAIFQVKLPNGTTESRYAYTDWGATMGKWGGFFSREKWDCEGYTDQSPKFVKGVRDGRIEWGFSGKHTEETKSDITPDDVRWLMTYLGQITDDQIRAGLRASGASPEQVACYTSAVRERITELQAVAKQ
jgi:hypothetical protein